MGHIHFDVMRCKITTAPLVAYFAVVNKQGILEQGLKEIETESLLSQIIRRISFIIDSFGIEGILTYFYSPMQSLNCL